MVVFDSLTLDDTCFTLVQDYEIGQILVSSLAIEIEKFNTEHPLLSEGLTQSLIRALKNITLADSCKSRIDSTTLFASINDLLEFKRSRQLLCSCLSVLKNLTTIKSGIFCDRIYQIDIRNVHKIILGTDSYMEDHLIPLNTDKLTLIQKINMLIWNSTDEVDNGIRNEGGRVNSNLVKIISKLKEPKLARCLLYVGSVALIVQIVTGVILTKASDQMTYNDFIKDDYVDYISNRASHTFPVVQNEGIVALVLFCSICPDAISLISRYHAPLLETFNLILKKDNSDIDMRKHSIELESITSLNASHLLLILCQGSGKFLYMLTCS